MPRARAAAIRALCARGRALGELPLDGARGLDDAVARLRALPGIGQWTAQYIAMRALGEPDAFPAGDLALRKALARGDAPISAAQAERTAEQCRPWRAYAAMELWRSVSERSAA